MRILKIPTSSTSKSSNLSNYIDLLLTQFQAFIYQLPVRKQSNNSQLQTSIPVI